MSTEDQRRAVSGERLAYSMTRSCLLTAQFPPGRVAAPPEGRKWLRTSLMRTIERGQERCAQHPKQHPHRLVFPKTGPSIFPGKVDHYSRDLTPHLQGCESEITCSQAEGFNTPSTADPQKTEITWREGIRRLGPIWKWAGRYWLGRSSGLIPFWKILSHPFNSSSICPLIGPIFLFSLQESFKDKCCV